MPSDPHPLASEAKQPTYTAQRGTVTRSLEFTARVAPVQQADLFFRADSHLSRLLVQRDETVRVSTRVALFRAIACSNLKIQADRGCGRDTLREMQY